MDSVIPFLLPFSFTFLSLYLSSLYLHILTFHPRLSLDMKKSSFMICSFADFLA